MTTRLKDVLRRDGVKLGHYVGEFATPGIGHILKEAGCEFVFLDAEHSGFGFDTLSRSLRYFEAADLPVMLRVPSGEPHHVARALDIGAEGVVVPMLSSAAQARELVRQVKYAPDGRRGVAPGIANDRYRPGPVVEGLAAANARTTIVALIETRAGVEEVEAIAATPGIDCLWVGHFDLSVSLGIPGRFDDPGFLAAVERIRVAGAAQGLTLGRMAGDVAGGAALAREGWDCICYSGDIWLYQAAVADGLKALRAALGHKGEARR